MDIPTIAKDTTFFGPEGKSFTNIVPIFLLDSCNSLHWVDEQGHSPKTGTCIPVWLIKQVREALNSSKSKDI